MNGYKFSSFGNIHENTTSAALFYFLVAPNHILSKIMGIDILVTRLRFCLASSMEIIR